MACEVYWTELDVAVHLARQFSLHFDVQRIGFQGVPPGLISRNIQVHADVAEVSQEYIFCARKLCGRPRKLLSATESVVPRRSPGALLCAFLELPFFPSQGPDDVVPIRSVCTLRSTAGRTAF